MAEEHVTEEGCIDAAAPSASGEFTGYGFDRVDWAVHRDGVRRSAVVGEGDTVWVGEIRCVEGGVFLSENGVDGATCLGAGVVRSEDATAITGSEGSDGGPELPVQDHGVEPAGDSVVVGTARESTSAGEGFGACVVDQGVEAAVGPEAEALFDAAFDVASADAPGPSAKDACEEGEGSL